MNAAERTALLEIGSVLPLPHGPDHDRCLICRRVAEAMACDAAEFLASLRRRQWRVIEGGAA